VDAAKRFKREYFFDAVKLSNKYGRKVTFKRRIKYFHRFIFNRELTLEFSFITAAYYLKTHSQSVKL